VQYRCRIGENVTYVGVDVPLLREGVFSSRPARWTDECDFCLEISGSSSSTFYRYYSELAPSRILASSEHFLAWPTLGQVLPGSFLIIPRDHVETMASLTGAFLDELREFVAELRTLMDPGQIVIYEHGARSDFGGGCGIYHAHIHLSPVPDHVAAAEVFDAEFLPAADYFEACAALHDSSQYLIFAGDHGAGYIDVEGGSREFPSQYFRQRLSALMGTDYPWDWRIAVQPEPEVIDTIARFAQRRVPQHR
jgi:diadenosine tetraphosphate (Ap4A) HIT family hydrolase